MFEIFNNKHTLWLWPLYGRPSYVWKVFRAICMEGGPKHGKSPLLFNLYQIGVTVFGKSTLLSDLCGRWSKTWKVSITIEFVSHKVILCLENLHCCQIFLSHMVILLLSIWMSHCPRTSGYHHIRIISWSETWNFTFPLYLYYRRWSYVWKAALQPDLFLWSYILYRRLSGERKVYITNKIVLLDSFKVHFVLISSHTVQYLLIHHTID